MLSPRSPSPRQLQELSARTSPHVALSPDGYVVASITLIRQLQELSAQPHRMLR
jgi:hypothetical protein